MDSRERTLMGAHGFDWDWWIFSLSFSVLALRDIRKPRWLARLLCKLGKHAWWLDGIFPDSKSDLLMPKYTCDKCGKHK
jgi:hypothetical protein